MNIAVDIDNTLCNNFEYVLCWAEIYNQTINGNNNEKNLSFNEMRDVFGWTVDQENEFWKMYIDVIARNISLRPFSNQVLQLLREEGHKVVFLTGRSEKLYPNIISITHKYLSQKGIAYDDIVFDCWGKGEYCKNNGLDVLIDDNPNICMNTANEGIPVICIETIYNHDFKFENVHKSSNWLDVYVQIQKIIGNEEYDLEVLKKMYE